MAPGPRPPISLSASLVGIARTILNLLRIRAELLVSESLQARNQLALLLLTASLAVLLLFLGTALALLLVVVAAWDTPYRLPVACAVAALPIAAGTACALWVRAQARHSSRLFDGSLTALADDLAALE